jgi:nicotinamidase-related amidase
MMPLHIAADPYAWPHDGQLEPATTALLIIDMQNDFCHPDGYVASMGYDIDGARRIIPVIAQLRAAIRAWGGHVLHTREGHRPDLADLTSLKLWRSRNTGIGIGGQGPLGRLLVRGEKGWEIVPELRPLADEPVVDKAGYSAFHNTDLQLLLARTGVRRLILTGVTTDICVHSTLRDAVERGYECLVVADACAATVRENHVAALNTIATEGGIFGATANAGAVIAAISREHAVPNARFG